MSTVFRCIVRQEVRRQGLALPQLWLDERMQPIFIGHLGKIHQYVVEGIEVALKIAVELQCKQRRHIHMHRLPATDMITAQEVPQGRSHHQWLSGFGTLFLVDEQLSLCRAFGDLKYHSRKHSVK